MKNIPKAKKQFGQNFLVNQYVINKIIHSLNLTKNNSVLEIGPGTGALTTHLISQSKKTLAVEIDRDLQQLLLKQFGEYENFALINDDILNIDLGSVDLDKPYTLVGNLPYNISTPILFKVLENMQYINHAYFMLQKEVGNRLMASPNCKDYGRLSIMVQFFARVDLVLHVAPTDFNPVPKVDSVVVKITPVYHKYTYDKEIFKQLGMVTQTAFNMRRKTIVNSLKGIIGAVDLEKLGINLKSRAENLSLQNYLDIVLHSRMELAKE